MDHYKEFSRRRKKSSFQWPFWSVNIPPQWAHLNHCSSYAARCCRLLTQSGAKKSKTFRLPVRMVSATSCAVFNQSKLNNGYWVRLSMRYDGHGKIETNFTPTVSQLILVNLRHSRGLCWNLLLKFHQGVTFIWTDNRRRYVIPLKSILLRNPDAPIRMHYLYYIYYICWSIRNLRIICPTWLSIHMRKWRRMVKWFARAAFSWL